MDKEKLKKYAGYFGLGFVGWLLNNSIVEILLGDLFIFNLFQCGLVAGLGGLLGGAITKKWWWALVGGFILAFLIFLIRIFDVLMMALEFSL